MSFCVKTNLAWLDGLTDLIPILSIILSKQIELVRLANQQVIVYIIVYFHKKAQFQLKFELCQLG